MRASVRGNSGQRSLTQQLGRLTKAHQNLYAVAKVHNATYDNSNHAKDEHKTFYHSAQHTYTHLGHRILHRYAPRVPPFPDLQQAWSKDLEYPAVPDFTAGTVRVSIRRIPDRFMKRAAADAYSPRAGPCVGGLP